MDLKVNYIYSKIGIEQSFGRLNIEKNNDFQLEITPSKLEIKNKKADENLYLKPNPQYIKEVNSNINNAIKKIAQQGDRLGDLRRGEKNVIANIAREKSLNNFFADNVSKTEKFLLDINFKPNYPKVDIKQSEINVTQDKIYPEFNWENGKINIYVQQKGGVEIDYKGRNVNKMA
ncbi:MAG: DUF6470 family protein [bacterium]